MKEEGEEEEAAAAAASQIAQQLQPLAMKAQFSPQNPHKCRWRKNSTKLYSGA